MSEIGFLFWGALFIAVSIALIFLWVRLQQNEEEVRLLRIEVSSKTSDTMYEFERKHRRDIQDELEALKEYLGVTAVKVDPKMQMVEKHKVAK
jgi:hypothetical protein